MKHVAIAERNASGHRLFYVRLLLDEADRLGIAATLITSPGVPEQAEYRFHLGDYRGRQRITVETNDWRLSHLCEIVRRERADLLLLPDGNLYLLDAAFARDLGNAPMIRLLLMRDPRWEFAFDTFPSFRAAAKLLVAIVARLRARAQLIWLREPGHTGRGSFANDPVVLGGPIADIISDSQRFREDLGMDNAVFWFGVTGVLNSAKNVDIVAAALHDLTASVDRPIGLALIGPVPQSAMAKVDSARRLFSRFELPIVFYNQILTNYEMSVGIKALDCVVAAYSRTYGPSATLGKAAALGVRSVAAGPRSLRVFSEKITGKKGVRISRAALANAFTLAINEPAPDPRGDLGPRQFASALLS